MFGRVVLALVSAPAYGIAIALAAMPVTLIGNFIVAMFGIFLIIIPILVILVALIVQVAIYVQSARYAGSFTGLIRINKQPDFFVSVGQGMLLTFLGQLIFTLAIVAVVLFFLEFRGGEALWWLNPEKLFVALQKAAQSPAYMDRIFTFEGFDLDGLLFTLRIVYMVFITILAIFMVPRACGLQWGMERSYTMPLVLVRFVIAMPFLAAVVGIVGHMIVLGLEWALQVVMPEIDVVVFIQYGVELGLFAGMIFAFEALLLRHGEEQAEWEAGYRAAADAQVAPNAYRALREQRMDDH